MKALEFIGGTIAAIVVVVGSYIFYKNQIPTELSVDDKKQRIKRLSYEDIISWVAKIVKKNNFDKIEGLQLNVIPSTALEKLVEQIPKITLSNSEKKKCMMLLIESGDEILLSKLVIPFELSQSLKDILPTDKIYVAPIKTQ